jgi:Predicted solute binding protein
MLAFISLALASPSRAPQAAELAQASPGPVASPEPATSTSPPTNTSEPQQDSQSDTQPTATRTATSTIDPSLSPSPSLTMTASSTLAPVATPTDQPGIHGAIACLPGDTIYIEGEAPPLTALLIYFDGQPVGGGTSDESGYYRLRLDIGNERTGTYNVQVRIRGTRQVLQEFTCGIQQATATPTRVRRTSPP